jgi:hypothetical protein
LADDEVIEDTDEEEILSAKEVARMIGTDARTFRKFMRAVLDPDDQPGQGGRYQIDAEEVPAIQKAFDKWSKPSKNGTKTRKTKITAPDDDEVVDLTDDEELVDEDDSDDDDAVELEDIEVLDE